MTYTADAQTKKISDFFTTTPPFSILTDPVIADLTQQAKFVRYRMGQTVLMREQMPAHITLIYSGQIRLLGYNSQTQMPITLKMLEAGELVGWASVLRSKPCETAIASVDTVCLQLPIDFFMRLVAEHTQLEASFIYSASLIEVYDLLGQVLAERADSDALLQACGAADLRELTLTLAPIAVVRNLVPGKFAIKELDHSRTWLISRGNITNYTHSITPRWSES